MADNYQQILDQALGGQFDAASFYRAKAKGFSDKDIVAAINASPGAATGQMKFIAQNYEKALQETTPYKVRGGTYSAGGQDWGPQLLVTPNRYNPYISGRDPEGGRFDRGYAKRGMSFAFGPMNAQEYLNEQYWAGQVNTNPEVNYRYNTGDVLDPEYDIDNQYGRLAEMDLSGKGGSLEYKQLAEQRAKAYDQYGPLGVNKWSSGLHESDPRFAQIAKDPAEYAKYFTETSPSKGSSEAARWIERALGGEVMTPAGGATATPSKASPLAGKEFKSVQGAYKSAQEGDQRFGLEDIRTLGKTTGKSMFDVVKSLRREKKEAGDTGGVLTQEARQRFRAAKERRQGVRKEGPTSFTEFTPSISTSREKPSQGLFEEREEPISPETATKGRRAKEVAQRAKEKLRSERQTKRPPTPTTTETSPGFSNI